jgi:hypothetical protein
VVGYVDHEDVIKVAFRILKRTSPNSFTVQNSNYNNLVRYIKKTRRSRWPRGLRRRSAAAWLLGTRV